MNSDGTWSLGTKYNTYHTQQKRQDSFKNFDIGALGDPHCT